MCVYVYVKGMGCYITKLFLFHCNQLQFVFTMHNSGESSVQRENGRGAVPLRRLLFYSHSERNNKYCSLRTDE